jgi:isoleucyl-tRNA synthetase
MSKSLGNVIAPDTIINEYGADVLRLWVATSDTNEDIRIGNEVMKQLSEIYRKLRNTLRYLTGALCETKMTMTIPDVETTHYINNSFRVPVVNLEHYVLLKVDMINRLVIKALENHDWKKVITEIHNFCVNDLSALYFDARKDVLYCGDFPSPIDMTPEFKTTSRVFAERETTINMMQFLFHHLVRWLAPVLPFATEEAWQSIFGNTSSIHTQTFDIKPITLGMDEFERMFEFSEYWQKMKSIRSDIMKELEDLRNKKVIRSSLEAMVTLDQTLTINSPEKWAFKDWENFLGVSMINSWIIAPPGYQGKLFKVKKIIGHSKCDRCWKVNVKGSLSHPVEGATRLCERCILQS